MQFYNKILFNTILILGLEDIPSKEVYATQFKTLFIHFFLMNI